jgi:F-type H+-transporting ATPase subunit b
MLATTDFWVAVGFFILIAAVARPLGRIIAKGLDARAERIRNSLDEAARLREEAQHMLAEYQRKQRDAAKEVEAILAHARDEARRSTEEGQAKLEATLARREQMAMDKIAQAEADALQQVRDTTVDIAIAATRALITERLDEATAARLADAAITELPGKLH